MSGRQWTQQQKNAIDARGGSLLVSAAAGSGKTAVLVERAVQMISAGENPIDADRLLILTFTNAAAEELRSRIAVRIEEELYKNKGSQTLKKQRLLLRRAFIGTMDAFCQSLVRENFALLNLPADIRLGDKAALAALAEEALAFVMEEMYKDEGFRAFAALYGKARSDREAAETILALYNFSRTLPFPEKHIEGYAKMYSDPRPIEETEWGRELFAYGDRALEAACRLNAAAMETARDDEALAVYCEALFEDDAMLASLKSRCAARDWDGCVRLLSAAKFSRMKQVRSYEGFGKSRVAALRDGVKAIFKDLAAKCFICGSGEYLEDIRIASPMIESICRAACLYSEKLYEAKLREHILDFSDFEHLALSLLQDENGGRSKRADTICRRYDAVMVDEYQDTNELQDALYSCLGSSAGDNLFYVGDVKQSIYRFRKAEPGIFIGKKNSWASYGEGKWPAVINLGHNFRSGEGVIEGVNYMFSTLMSPALGDIEYNRDEMLIQGSDGGDEAGMELCVLDDPDAMGDADYCAARIKQLCEEKYMVRDKEGLRSCNFGDFAILLRARSKMPEYMAALERQGIPFIADAADEAVSSPEVLPVISLLGAIDNPGNDVYLTAALYGPFFAFSTDEMLELRLSRKKGSLWGALSAFGSEKTEKCVKELRYLRAYGASSGVGGLCRHIVNRSGYISAVLAMESGAARLENLRRFLEWADEIQATGRGGIADFLRIIDSGQGPEGAGAKALKGHVSLMTIHKSKGLEFPVCILADAAHRFNTQDLTQRVQMDTVLGIGMQLRGISSLYNTLPLLAVRSKIQRQNMSEEMRVFYVALTRAKDRLIMCFASRDAEKYIEKKALALTGRADSFALSGALSMADWIITAALLHPGNSRLLEYCGGCIPPLMDTKSIFNISVESNSLYADPENRGLSPEFAFSAKADGDCVAKILKGFAMEVPGNELSQVASKLSVSSLVRQEGSFIPKRPSFMYKEGLTAAEKGTTQHSFMQYADYENAAADIEAEIKRLVEGGYLSEAASPLIDRQGVARFLSSPLYERLSKADRLYREYDFITAVEARLLRPDLPEELHSRQIMLQGIADMVIVKDGRAEIADYKTDRKASAAQLAERYGSQLRLYASAVSKRLGMEVDRLTIWSFALGEEIDVSLGDD